MSDDSGPRPTDGRSTGIANTSVVVAGLGAELATELVALITEAPDLELAGQADDAASAIELVAEVVPDVVLLGTSPTGPPAAEVCAAMVQRAPVSRVVVVTDTDGHEEGVYDALVAGAAGFLAGELSHSRALEAIRRTAWRECLLDTALASRLLDELVALDSEAGEGPVVTPSLSPTEREVLQRMASGAAPESIASLHDVPVRLVNLHAGFALAKLQRYRRDLALRGR